MSIRSSKDGAGRGTHVWWVSALGLALVVMGVVLAQTTPSPRATTERPFVVAPQVRFEKVTPPRPSRTAEGVPLRLVVPRLAVNAPVVRISATDGVLLPPDDPQTLGWWSSGARPGAALGGALITGHTVHSGGGAFDDLETLEVGDRVRVRTARGRLRYVVSGVVIYRKASLAEHAEQVFSQEVPGRLVLVTCEDWDGATYLSNAVVLADPVPGR